MTTIRNNNDLTSGTSKVPNNNNINNNNTTNQPQLTENNTQLDVSLSKNNEPFTIKSQKSTYFCADKTNTNTKNCPNTNNSSESGNCPSQISLAHSSLINQNPAKSSEIEISVHVETTENSSEKRVTFSENQTPEQKFDTPLDNNIVPTPVPRKGTPQIVVERSSVHDHTNKSSSVGKKSNSVVSSGVSELSNGSDRQVKIINTNANTSRSSNNNKNNMTKNDSSRNSHSYDYTHEERSLLSESLNSASRRDSSIKFNKILGDRHTVILQSGKSINWAEFKRRRSTQVSRASRSSVSSCHNHRNSSVDNNHNSHNHNDESTQYTKINEIYIDHDQDQSNSQSYSEDNTSNQKRIILFIKAGSDRECIGCDPISQRIFMILWLKGINFNVTTVYKDSIPKDLKDIAPGSVPPFLLFHDYEPLTDNIEIEAFLESNLQPPEYPSLTCKYNRSMSAGCDIFQKFSAWVRNKSESKEQMLLERMESSLEKFEQYLRTDLENSDNQEGTMDDRLFIDGNKMTLADCNILPKLNILVVAAKARKNWNLPKKFSRIHTYLENARKCQEFSGSCADDQEIDFAYGGRGKRPGK